MTQQGNEDEQAAVEQEMDLVDGEPTFRSMPELDEEEADVDEGTAGPHLHYEVWKSPLTTPTQIREPAQASNRTALQALVAGLIVFVGILPLILQEVLTGMGDILSPKLYAFVAGAAVITAAVASTLAKVMAIPGVNDWLRKHVSMFAASKNEE